jgi:cytochrome c peroxidase
MRDTRVLRSLRWIILLLPMSVAIAQVGPPPPPPPPPPLGPPPQPAGNLVTVAKANLGKALFWDEQLSSTRTVACGTCHRAATGGSDPRSIEGMTRALHPGRDQQFGTPDDVVGSPGVPLNQAAGDYEWAPSFGLAEQVTGRRAPSHIDAGYSPELFWDGRAGRAFTDPVSGDTLLPVLGALEAQAAGPPVSSAEMGHLGRDWNDVAARVQTSTPLALSTVIPADLAAWIAGRSYPQLFQEAFGSPQVTPARIAMAIASYERTLFSSQTPFDSANAGQAVLTPQENAGRQLFATLPCARCHAGALTSDNLYHYIGVRPAAEDSGRFVVSRQPIDLGAFRTPSLRNVALRPSFMHDGRFATLEEVVDFYDRGGDFNAPNKSPLITPLNLTPLQKAQLVAFLRRPLTDPRVASGAPPFDQPSLFSESSQVPRLLGGGTAGAGGRVPRPVAIEPPLAGNPRFTVAVENALAGAPATLVIDEVEPPASGGVPAGASFARLATTLRDNGAGGGYGSVTLAIPDDPALLGRELFGRWYVADAAAPGGVASSASFRMTIFGPHGQGLPAAVPSAGALPTPRLLRLHAGAPNPFAARTTLRYEVFATAPVRLSIYDVAGRTVRRLVSSPLVPPGSYSVEWDGRDDAGRPVAGGVYFSRLEGGGAVESDRVVRVD